MVLGVAGDHGGQLGAGDGALAVEAAVLRDGGETNACRPVGRVGVPLAADVAEGGPGQVSISGHQGGAILGGHLSRVGLSLHVVEGLEHCGAGHRAVGGEYLGLSAGGAHDAVLDNIMHRLSVPRIRVHIRPVGGLGLLRGLGRGVRHCDTTPGLPITSLSDRAAQLIGDIIHQDLIHGNSQIIVDGSSLEGIVGIAAGSHEVIGGNGVSFGEAEVPAPHAFNGDAPDGSGSVVGGAGVLLALVIGHAGVYGEYDAGHLGEPADGSGRAVGGGLQRLQQLGSGNLDDAQRVAEGEHGVDILLGDVPGGDAGADAASVGNGRVHRLAFPLGAPDQSVGDQVAQIGFLRSVAGLTLAVKKGLRAGKHRAVLLVYLGLDLGGTGSHRFVGQADAFGGDALGSDPRLVENDHSDVCQLGAGGGGHGVAHLIALGHSGDIFHGGMGVPVNEHINAGDLGQQIHGAVTGGLIVNAQMPQADNIITAFGLQRIHLLLRSGEERLTGQEGNALDLGGVGFGGGLRGIQAEHTDLDAVLRGEYRVGAEGHRVSIEDVGGHDGELRFIGQRGQIGVAVVKFVVAGGRHIIPCQIHQLHGGCPFRDADGGISLDEITGVHQQDIGARLLHGGFQGGHLGIAGDGAVHVIGMQDHDLSGHIVRNRVGGGLRGRLLCRRRCGQGEYQGRRQQQRQQFFLLHSFASTFLFHSSDTICPYGLDLYNSSKAVRGIQEPAVEKCGILLFQCRGAENEHARLRPFHSYFVAQLPVASAVR